MPGPEFWRAATDLVVIVAAVLSAVAARYAQRANRGAERAGDHAAAVRHQVENSHSTVMRDDLDAIAERLEIMQRRNDATHEALWLAIHGRPTPPPPTGPITLEEAPR